MGFRYYTQKTARNLCLRGYVRNLADGRVEVFATGTLAQLENLRAALLQGPLFSNVSNIQEEDALSDAPFENDFVITTQH